MGDSGRRVRFSKALDELLEARHAAFAAERARGEPIDPFVLFRRNRDELTYSSILRWLLDERGSHGMGRQFAARLLGCLDIPLPAPRYTTALEVRGVESRVDILLDSPRLVLGIENKVDSGEGEDQTGRELRDLHRVAGSRDVHLVYLTPTGSRAREPAAQPLSWKQVGNVLMACAAEAPVATRPWLEAICANINREFHQGGHFVRTEFEDDVKLLFERWDDFQELKDTFDRAQSQIEEILRSVGTDLQHKWGGEWMIWAEDGALYIRRPSWGDDSDRVRFALCDCYPENLLGRTQYGAWYGIDIVGERINQPRFAELLATRASELGERDRWEIQPQSADGHVMWRGFPRLTPAELVPQLASRSRVALEELSPYSVVIDEYLRSA